MLAGLAVFLRPQFFNDQVVPEPEIQSRIVYEHNQVIFSVRVPDHHHITDRKHGFFWIKVEGHPNIRIDDVEFPAGEVYGDETVYKGEFQLKARFIALRKIDSPVKLKFTVGYQLCQEKPGEICFAPDSQEMMVVIEKPVDRATEKAGSDPAWIPSVTDSGSTEEEIPEKTSFFNKIEQLLTRELEKKSLLMFVLAFLLGFLTSLTPCVYPVIPIIMGVVGSQSQGSKLRGFYLSIFFVLGLATVYSSLGVLAAASGSLIGATFQNPIVVVVIAAIFVLMGLSLAGVFEIPIPTSISSKVQAGGYKSRVIGSLVIGGVAGIVAAPCAGPVMIAILSWISQTRNLLTGFLVMLVFSLGMGAIFVLVGTFSGIISALPKGGRWMGMIKDVFAVLLIVGGLLVLGMVIPQWLQLRLWGIFLIGLAIFMGLFKPQEDDVKKKFFKVMLVLVFLWGVVLFFRSFLPPDMTRTGFEVSTSTGELNWMTDLNQGKREALQQNKKLMIDTTADWCVACGELEKHTFSHPEVRAALRGFILVKMDFTRRTEQTQKLSKSLGIIGMPTVIFLNPDGTEIKRFSGFKTRTEFLKILNTL